MICSSLFFTLVYLLQTDVFAAKDKLEEELEKGSFIKSDASGIGPSMAVESPIEVYGRHNSFGYSLDPTQDLPEKQVEHLKKRPLPEQKELALGQDCAGEDVAAILLQESKEKYTVHIPGGKITLCKGWMTAPSQKEVDYLFLHHLFCKLPKKMILSDGIQVQNPCMNLIFSARNPQGLFNRIIQFPNNVLHLSGGAITKISGSFGPYLTKLDLSNNEISNVSALSGAVNLEELNIKNNPLIRLEDLFIKETPLVFNLRPLLSLHSLTSLAIGALLKDDFNVLSRLKSLTSLSITSTHSSYLKNISSLEGLKKLEIGNCDFEEASFLSPLINLTELVIINSHLSNISALSALANLEVLIINNNKIQDLKPISGLIKLRRLMLFMNWIEDVSPLSPLVNLKELSLSANKIKDPSALVHLKSLVSLDLQYNPVNEDQRLKINLPGCMINFE